MESVTSMMSVSANDGVRNLDDDEADQLDFTEHSAETSAQLLEITNKFSELLNSKDDEEEEKEEKENDVKSKAEKRLFGKTGQYFSFALLIFVVSWCGGAKFRRAQWTFVAATRDASLR